MDADGPKEKLIVLDELTPIRKADHYSIEPEAPLIEMKERRESHNYNYRYAALSNRK